MSRRVKLARVSPWQRPCSAVIGPQAGGGCAMKIVVCVAALTMLAVPMTASAHRHRERTVVVERSPLRGDVHVVFSRGEAQVLREYYAPRYRNLPPGLRKKLARTGRLPPGWERRVQPLPVI